MLPRQFPVKRMTVAGVETSATSTAELTPGMMRSRIPKTALCTRAFSPR